MCLHDGSGISVTIFFKLGISFGDRSCSLAKEIHLDLSWEGGVFQYLSVWFFCQHFIVKRAGENNAIVGYIDLHGL